MKNLNFEFIKANEKQSFYKLSERLTKDDSGKSILGSLEEMNLRVKAPYNESIYSDGYDCICISDADTHYERIAFAAFMHEEEVSRLPLKIGGNWTMMIHGGDINSIKEPIHYISLIAKANGYTHLNETPLENTSKYYHITSQLLKRIVDPKSLGSKSLVIEGVLSELMQEGVISALEYATLNRDEVFEELLTC